MSSLRLVRPRSVFTSTRHQGGVLNPRSRKVVWKIQAARRADFEPDNPILYVTGVHEHLVPEPLAALRTRFRVVRTQRLRHRRAYRAAWRPARHQALAGIVRGQVWRRFRLSPISRRKEQGQATVAGPSKGRRTGISKNALFSNIQYHTTEHPLSHAQFHRLAWIIDGVVFSRQVFITSRTSTVDHPSPQCLPASATSQIHVSSEQASNSFS